VTRLRRAQCTFYSDAPSAYLSIGLAQAAKPDRAKSLSSAFSTRALDAYARSIPVVIHRVPTGRQPFDAS